MGKVLIYMGFAVWLFSSCGQKKAKPSFYVYDSSDNDETTEQYTSSTGGGASPSTYERGQIIGVPFIEKNGVKYLPVSVNGFGFQMILDTGCSGAMISLAEAQYLYEKGYLTSDDIIGVTQSQIADGSIVDNMTVNLHDVVIGEQIYCKDVVAVVASNSKAPLLLGNEILDRVAAYSVDNEHKVIYFKLK